MKAELQAIDVDLKYQRRQAQETQMLQDQILKLEGDNQVMRNKVDILMSEKIYYEREFQIQKSQLES